VKCIRGLAFVLALSLLPLLGWGQDALSLSEQRKETLAYGIDSEIIDLIQTLINDEDDSLVEDVVVLYESTTNATLRERALDYFIALETVEGVKAVKETFRDWDLLRDQVLIKVMDYLITMEVTDSLETFEELLESENQLVADRALRAYGAMGGRREANRLLELLDDDDFDPALKPAVIRALGETGLRSVKDRLFIILDDPDEEAEWRRAAAEALSNFSGNDVIDALARSYGDEDTILRSIVVASLAEADGAGAEALLIEALRDSFWRVRVAASTSLGERQSRDALDILWYKVRRDPELRVKEAALRAIAKIGGGGVVRAAAGGLQRRRLRPRATGHGS
jgi:HEAT repeat protein